MSSLRNYLIKEINQLQEAINKKNEEITYVGVGYLDIPENFEAVLWGRKSYSFPDVILKDFEITFKKYRLHRELSALREKICSKYRDLIEELDQEPTTSNKKK